MVAVVAADRETMVADPEIYRPDELEFTGHGGGGARCVVRVWRDVAAVDDNALANTKFEFKDALGTTSTYLLYI
jgi:hypothetical protein